jgi:hypothetical protein
MSDLLHFSLRLPLKGKMVREELPLLQETLNIWQSRRVDEEIHEIN